MELAALTEGNEAVPHGRTGARRHCWPVSGDTAVVTGCLRSTMIEVDVRTRPVETMENYVGVSEPCIYR